MAITLPYPDLVFVPLDKLTAEEMNEIVANYTAIANDSGGITEDYKTGSGAVSTIKFGETVISFGFVEAKISTTGARTNVTLPVTYKSPLAEPVIFINATEYNSYNAVFACTLSTNGQQLQIEGKTTSSGSNLTQLVNYMVIGRAS